MAQRELSVAWLLSAASALLVGAQLACEDDSDPAVHGKLAPARAAPSHTASAAAPGAVASGEPRVDRDCCMGLNECRGQGGCAVPESHSCRGQNACRGKGGCNAHCPM